MGRVMVWLYKNDAMCQAIPCVLTGKPLTHKERVQIQVVKMMPLGPVLVEKGVQRRNVYTLRDYLIARQRVGARRPGEQPRTYSARIEALLSAYRKAGDVQDC
jgi:hypothetical protein